MTTATADDAGLRRLWAQRAVPVLFNDKARRRLLVKLPYAPDNAAWLALQGGRHYLEWLPRYTCWQVPLSWLNDLARRLVGRFGGCYLVQPYRQMEKCAPACWNAKGLDCECSCMGENHGGGAGGRPWYVVSEACAVCWGPRQYSCRLLARPGGGDTP
jgi:hypothetical protein